MYELIIGEDCSCTDIIVSIALRTGQSTLNDTKVVCNYYMLLALFWVFLPSFLKGKKNPSLTQHLVLPLSLS